MSSTTTIILCVVVPMLLSGFISFYAHKTWILYLPLFGFLLGLGYLGHLAISSYAGEPKDTPRVRLDLPPIEPPATPSTPMKNDRPNITNITSENQSGGFTGINQGVLNQGPAARVITEQKRKQLVSALRANSGGSVMIVHEGSSSDAEALSESLISVLNEVGLSIGRTVVGTISIVGGPRTTGIDVAGKEPLRGELIRALNAIGLPAQEWPSDDDTTSQNFTVVITIRKVPTP